MPRPHLPSRFLTTGLFLALLLTVLAWGFRQAPEAARQVLLPTLSTPLVEVEPISYVGPTEGFADLYLEERAKRDIQSELTDANTFFLDHCIQRPRLPPPAELTAPIYPGCEGEADYEERVFCGFKRLNNFIETNKVEPEGSLRERVIWSFDVDEHTGLMDNMQLRRGLNDRNIAEAERILRLLIDRQVRWTPGTRQGEPATFTVAIPVSFHGARCGE